MPGTDLNKLTREEKIQLLAALEEKRRRALIQKATLEPTPGQMAVITSPALERYLFCGNGFGKSCILVNEVHWAATGWNPFTKQKTPVPAKICLMLDSPEKVQDFVAEYRKWNPLTEDQLHKAGKPHWSSITYPNGSAITVYSHQVEPLKLEGSQWTHIFFDEPPPKDVFVAIFRGARIKGRPARVLLAGTPITAAWLRTEVWEPWVKGQSPTTECFRGESSENAQNLESGWLERFSSKLTAKEKQIRLKGEFFDLDGLALSHLFRRTTHVVHRADMEWGDHWPCCVITDPHPSKAHVAILMGCDPDNRLYVLDEFKEKLVARDFATALVARGWFRDYNVIDVVHDSLGEGDTTSGEGFKSFATVMNEVLAPLRKRTRATTFEDKCDEDFIERIRDNLLLPPEPSPPIPRLRILSHCIGSVEDIERVEWFQDKQIKENKPKLDLRKRDFLACIKYGLATRLFYDKPRRTKPYYVTGSPYGIKLNRGTISLRSQARSRPTRDDDW